MAVHSTQLAAVHVTSGSLSGVYTVPSGIRTILKSLVAQNQASAANRLQVAGYHGATLQWILQAYMAAINTSGDTQILLPWIVLNAGDSIEVAAASNGVYAVLSGTELVLP